jgi:Helix-turn-helix domain, rpiR family
MPKNQRLRENRATVANSSVAGAQRAAPPRGILTRLDALRSTLPPAAARIAGYIVDHAHAVVQMSVTEVAEAADASEGSVINLCQSIGVRGFQQLKLALACDLVEPVQLIHEDLERNDTTQIVTEKIFNTRNAGSGSTCQAGRRDNDLRHELWKVAAVGICRHRPYHHGTRNAVSHRGDDKSHR